MVLPQPPMTSEADRAAALVRSRRHDREIPIAPRLCNLSTAVVYVFGRFLCLPPE